MTRSTTVGHTRGSQPTGHGGGPRSDALESTVACGAAASLWLRAMLSAPPREVRVVGAGHRAAYLRTATGDVVAIESPAGVRLPNALVLDGRSGAPGDLSVGASGTVGAGHLLVGPHVITVRRWWDPTPRLGHVDKVTVPASAMGSPTTAGTTGPTDHHAAVRRLAHAASGWDVRVVPAVVGALIGRGLGSTPAGDDVVAGLLATVRVFTHAAGPHGVAFADDLAAHALHLAHRTTTLSATLLRCADRGAVAAPAARVLRAAAGYGAWAPAAAALQTVGHTSGRDLLTGIVIGLHAITGRRRV